MSHNKTYFNWSGGKDSALSLYHVMKDADYDVQLLLTSVNSSYNRVSMHGVRTSLLIAQARNLGLPLEMIELPETVDMEQYNAIMRNKVKSLTDRMFTHAVFGDIFLEDLRTYREQQLAHVGVKTHFPIWQRNTRELLSEFIALGSKAVVVCVQAKSLDETFLGRELNEDFINDLPLGVDICGENGEFHTFVYDGPIFEAPVQFSIGEKVLREYPDPKSNDQEQVTQPPMGFWYCDLIPN